MKIISHEISYPEHTESFVITTRIAVGKAIHNHASRFRATISKELAVRIAVFEATIYVARQIANDYLKEL